MDDDNDDYEGGVDVGDDNDLIIWYFADPFQFRENLKMSFVKTLIMWLTVKSFVLQLRGFSAV